MTLLQSAALLTFNEQRQVLGVTRRGTTDNWGLPGGKVDPGETHEEAAIRETFEETGIVVYDAMRGFVRNDGEYECHLFIAKHRPGPLVQEPNGGIPAWIDPQLLIAPGSAFMTYNTYLLHWLGLVKLL